MTNAEKFLKEGVDKEKFCYELARHLNATVGNDEARTKEFMAIVDYFLDCLCVPTLTEDEKVILRNIKKYYITVARDKAGDLFIAMERDENGVRGTNDLEFNRSLFKFIKNGEEFSIEELLDANNEQNAC